MAQKITELNKEITRYFLELRNPNIIFKNVNVDGVNIAGYN
jgi:hypothetical protein